jgi:hypothetical protein
MATESDAVVVHARNAEPQMGDSWPQRAFVQILVKAANANTSLHAIDSFHLVLQF